MKRVVRGLVVSLVELSLGCESNGLSVRERGNESLSSFTYALYDAAPTTQPAPAVQFPMRLAVAQVGEVTPPGAVMDTLGKEGALFRRVQPIPGSDVGPAGEVAYPTTSPADQAAAARARAAEQVRRMRRLAADLGADHLLLIGGTIDSSETSTGLAAADLTIVGAFIVPSRSIQAEARAAGALIDVNTGQVVQLSGADASKSSLRSAAGVENGELNTARDARNAVMDKLAKNFIQDCTRRGSSTTN